MSDELTNGGPGLRLVPLSAFEARNVRWLLPGLILLRAITLVAGVGGLGKSMWLASVAARGSRGELLDGTPFDTVIVSYEDMPAEVLRPRVEAAGGDPDRVHVIVPESRDEVLPVALPRDVYAVAQLVRAVGARLLVIDPIVASMEVEFDAFKDQHVRVVLAELADMAEELELAVVIVGHLNKAPSTEAYLRVANSTGFWNASRSVVLVTEDSSGEDLRLVTQRKANYARLHPVERHRVEPILLPHLVDPADGQPVETARMVFVEYADDVDGADVLAGTRRDDKTARAVEFLQGARRRQLARLDRPQDVRRHRTDHGAHAAAGGAIAERRKRTTRVPRVDLVADHSRAAACRASPTNRIWHDWRNRHFKRHRRRPGASRASRANAPWRQAGRRRWQIVTAFRTVAAAA